MSSRQSGGAVPVILLTGYLGAGKTSLLNHLLRHPDARIGVVVNDFGDLNIDAGLVVGQVDEPFSISGGCICCLSDDTSLEDGLTALAKPRLRLDAIIVEASGFAEPLTLARMVTRMGRHRFHLGGVIDVVDATMHAATVDTESAPPMRYAATTLVLVNKLDQLPAADRTAAVDAISQRVHQRNPRLLVVGTSFGRLDPALIFDPGSGADRAGEGVRPGTGSAGKTGSAGEAGGTVGPVQAELPIRELIRQAYAESAQKDLEGQKSPDGEKGLEGESAPVHRHAQSVTVTGHGCADADAVLDLLEDLPTGVYRVKGSILVADRVRRRTYGVQAVGPNVYVSSAVPQETTWDNAVVVIGESFDEGAIRAGLERALGSDGSGNGCGSGNGSGSGGVERLRRYLHLHS